MSAAWAAPSQLHVGGGPGPRCRQLLPQKFFRSAPAVAVQSSRASEFGTHLRLLLSFINDHAARVPAMWSQASLEPPEVKPATKRSARALTQLLPSSLQACLSGPQGFAAHWLRSPFATCSIPLQQWRGAKSTSRLFRAGRCSLCGGLMTKVWSLFSSGEDLITVFLST